MERNPEINNAAFEFVVNSVDDGWLFESFAQSFLAGVFNYEFMPIGGVKDKGIDGLAHTFTRKGFVKQIYQLSTEKDVEGKINRTITTLINSEVKFDVITYVTNRSVKNKDAIIDSIYDQKSIRLKIFDLGWFIANVHYSQGTRNAYFTYLHNHFHEYTKPGKSFVVSKIDTDSRIFVFLRQQLESKWSEYKIDDLLADSLILFSLEGTDPDTSIFKSKEDIKDAIRQFVQFDPKLLEKTIDRRLAALSTKPRKINYHQATEGYCLPHETRIDIAQRNLSDKNLMATFYEQSSIIIKRYLREQDVNVRDMAALIDSVVHKIFYQQGLEFSNFILHGKSQKSIDKDLQDIINHAVDESSVIEKNKELVKTGLQIAIREIVYQGTAEQRQYFKSLSNTYMMMFLLQWNPQVALYFETMASKLSIFVCTSIIVPAFSEYFLDHQNKRHWNLLKATQQLGIRLFISDEILDELIHHLRMIRNKYEALFEYCEDVYLMSELQMLYIDEVLIRAYFHAKGRGRVKTFNEFLDCFCDPSVKSVRDDLIQFLLVEFGITYISRDSLRIGKINEDEYDKLTGKLIRQGTHKFKAETDAKTILTIYRLRETNNESSTSGIFGYKTWWLSKDTKTFKAVQSLFKDRYPVSCYMRADFLYNHITLAPKRQEVDLMYRNIFPSLLGVNLSFHLSKDVTDYVQNIIAEHANKTPGRIQAIIQRLSEKLKTDASARDLNSIKLFLDEELATHTRK